MILFCKAVMLNREDDESELTKNFTNSVVRMTL
jgi:hypothetical protein